MTNDELLARIIGDDGEPLKIETVRAWQQALRAVVELHKPEQYQLPAKFRGGEKGEWDTFHRCKSCFITYPCPTIQAVLDNLK
ncbi:hypothetical protein UFOVP1608_47 [uncultured Caudovirales phage]|uniref:Uncharacterized protein n=1 Tax=uncultured Caudovirales phage TaxID=2100421 RepID=A0A6J5SVB1_9CAUD|nr:hypothetical protein UFOVP1608_47 [uncultured Caudovirales phage]